VAHGGLPDIAVVHGGRAPQLDAFGVVALAQAGHVVFPADGCADLANGGSEDRQRRAIALAPDQALAGGGHKFAVFAKQFASGAEEQYGAVERGAATLNDTDHEMCFHFSGEGTDADGFRTRNIDRGVPVADKIRAAAGAARSDAGAEIEAFGVTADIGLRKDGKLGTVRGGFLAMARVSRRSQRHWIRPG
jgi:hypothetical protein